MRLSFDLFKLRIGLVIGFTAMADLAATPGPSLPGRRIFALALAVTLASAAAGAFTIHRARSGRANGPHASPRVRRGPAPFGSPRSLRSAPVACCSVAANALAAVHTFLGAFTYGVQLTLLLIADAALHA